MTTMYKRRVKKRQTALQFVPFQASFLKQLRKDDRWVVMAQLIPWEKYEEAYCAHFSDTGNDALPFRVALGSLIIKEMLTISDRETVIQIQENPYVQYFLGFDCYRPHDAV